MCPPGYVAGVTAPQYGMPITGTPIGLAGPPHVPLGVPAGLQQHVMVNHTHVYLPQPETHDEDRRQAGAGHPLSGAGQPRPHRGACQRGQPLRAGAAARPRLPDRTARGSLCRADGAAPATASPGSAMSDTDRQFERGNGQLFESRWNVSDLPA